MKSSMQDDLKKFAQIKRNETVVFLESILNSLEKKFNYGPIIVCGVTLLMMVIAILLSCEKDTSFWMVITPLLCTLAIFVFMIIVASISIIIESFSEKEILKDKISNQMYKGSLHEIFNMDCTITRNVLSENKKYIADNIFKYKGLSGKIILELLNQINLDISLDSQKQNVKEETDALVAAKTTIGKMIEEVNGISTT